MSSSLFPEIDVPEEPRRTPQSWRKKFQDALRGLKLGVRGQSSFFVHIFFAAVVIAAAVVLQCSRLEWCLLLGCIGGVLVTELLNTAIEVLFRGLDERQKEKVWPCLDIAAAAVLLACLMAVAIGAIIFVPRVWAALNPAM